MIFPSFSAWSARLRNILSEARMRLKARKWRLHFSSRKIRHDQGHKPFSSHAKIPTLYGAPNMTKEGLNPRNFAFLTSVGHFSVTVLRWKCLFLRAFF